MDVEKVPLRRPRGVSTHTLAAATVSIVNEDGKLILWAFIKHDHDNVCKYDERMTGLTREKLALGIDLSVVSEYAIYICH